MSLISRSFDTFIVYVEIPETLRTDEAEKYLRNAVLNSWEGYVETIEVKRLRHKVVREEQLELPFNDVENHPFSR